MTAFSSGRAGTRRSRLNSKERGALKGDAETTMVPAQGRQTIMSTRRSRAETARLGDKIYERDIRP